MFEGFKPVNLAIGLPSISITSNGVAFSKAAIIKMEKTEHVVLMINELDKQVAVQKCAPDDANATQFYKMDKRIVSVRWNNKDFLNTLSKMMNWNLEEEGYKVYGEFYSDEVALVFDLKTAQIIDGKADNEDA